MADMTLAMNGRDDAQSFGTYVYKDARAERLDIAVGTLAEMTRSKAQRLIREGNVQVNGTPATKPSMKVAPGSRIQVLHLGDEYVSRGAYKLIGAFDAFADQGLGKPQGLDCLDIGASTGGFCDVLLRRGAAHVIALDVGHGQLDPQIAQDPRIIEMSGVNIRDVHSEDLPYAPQMIVSDVSFISLTYVLPVVARIAAHDAQIVLLVKPQFEVGRTNLGKHGIVTDPQLREQALHTVIDSATEQGLNVVAHAPSPIEGMHGNHEYLLYLRS